MLGSESARERIKPSELLQFHTEDHEERPPAAAFTDIYQHKPPGLDSSQILMMHSTRDAVISRLAIQQLVIQVR